MANEEPNRSLLGPAVLVGIGLVLLVQRWPTGGFNLYDGTIQHKLLGLHQVRAGAANNLPTTWCSSAWPRDAAGRVARAPSGQFAERRAKSEPFVARKR